jgi:hypothetical protein
MRMTMMMTKLPLPSLDIHRLDNLNAVVHMILVNGGMRTMSSIVHEAEHVKDIKPALLICM